MNQKPKHLLVFKIVGIIGLLVSIVGFVLVIIGFSDFDGSLFIVGGAMLTFGLFIGGSCLTQGFKPAIAKMHVKTTKYIQEENKEDFTDMANTTADIINDAVVQTASAVKNGIKDSKYCKYCGKEIDADAIFCSRCGKKQ